MSDSITVTPVLRDRTNLDRLALESVLDSDVEKIVGHAVSPISSVVPPDSRSAA